MKAAGYTRVSTPSQVKEGESLHLQEDAIQNYANTKNWELTEIYSDKGESGAKQDRPELMRLLQDGKDKKFQALIVHRLSRFGRNARELLNNYHTLKEYGTEVHFVKEQIDSSTTTGRLLLTIMAAIAEMEREIIEEQMAENKLSKWRDNRAFVGTLPLGYSWNKETKEIEAVQEEAKLYTRIVSLYLDEGLSFTDIALKLTAEGIKGKRGGRLTSEAMSYILKNPAYYGNLVVNQYQYDGKRRTKKKKPESEHISFEIPALISKTKWDRIQERTQFNRKKGKKSTLRRKNTF